MSESYSHNFHSLAKVLWCGKECPTFKNLEESAKGYTFEIDSASEINEALEAAKTKYQVLIIELSRDNFLNQIEFLKKWQTISPATSMIVLVNNIDINEIQELVNVVQIFSFVKKKNRLFELLLSAIDENETKKNYFGALQKIKEQNAQLELLNKNLEDLVHERTKKEFSANINAIDSLRKIQEILRFIKQVSRSETIEDLMTVVRKEFKKFHGLRPPMLCFTESSDQLRFFYFQGKQFTQRIIQTKDFNLNQGATAPLRKELSNLLGRPFGPIEIIPLEFKSPQMSTSFGVIFCENSFNDEAHNEFKDFSQERWPIVNLAIESLLLREKSHVIARQWAVTFNEMTDPILILDKNYRINLDNSNFAQKDESYCFVEFAGRMKPCIGCPLTETFATGKAHSSDIHCRGQVFRVHSYPIHLDSSGKVSHVIHQYADITSFKDLQGKVVQGEKMAAIGMLAGNVAHELNNPLTGIHSLAGLVLNDLDESTNAYKDLSEIRDASKRCQQIIKNLLEFSSLGGATKAELIEVNDMINKTLPMLKMAMRYHNNQILLSDSQLYIEFNPQLFQQVVFNLVNNACQAMEKGGRLHVHSYSENNFCYISVRDSGTGIPDEIKDHIFDPFFTTKEKDKGTGLGLSMSRQVVEKFSGTLTLHSTGNKGSEFLIQLPRVEKIS